MIYLDTHVVAWLYAGQLEKFSQLVKDLMNENEIHVSPIVRLELQYLYEIQRIIKPPNIIMTDLSERIGLKICDKHFNAIVNQALTLSWTRDPFDRIIVAQANLHSNILISKDQKILDHYSKATW